MNEKLNDIIDIDKLQDLLQKYTDSTGVATAVLDLEGNVKIATGWQDICTKFHRMHPEAKMRCYECDVDLANKLKGGQKYNVYKCLNGLVDVAIPLFVNNTHIGNIFSGQYLSDKPDIDFFKKQAEKFGFDENEYLNALAKVPIFSDEQAKSNMEFLSSFASFIGEAGLTKQNLIQLSKNQEQRINERTKALKDMQLASLNMMQDTEDARRTIEKANNDLTKLMEEIKKSNLELEQFAYIASHDLQEPLRMVSSYTQLLERRYKDKLDKDASEFNGYAVDGAKRMQILINDLLDYSRVTTKGKPLVKLDLSFVLRSAISNLNNKIEETGAIITSDELPICKGDESQLIRLFQNLLDNAMKFTIDHKPIIHISCKAETKRFIISVKDNGIGIEADYQEKVFTIFQRLHNKTEFPGTGLGLAICKRTIERHNGKIWFESEFGRGTTFKFTLNKIKGGL